MTDGPLLRCPPKINHSLTIEQSDLQSYSQSHRSKLKRILMSEDKVIIGSFKTVDQDSFQKAENKKYKLWVDKDIVKEKM
jgi:hypothetical protein